MYFSINLVMTAVNFTHSLLAKINKDNVFTHHSVQLYVLLLKTSHSQDYDLVYEGQME